MIFFAPFVLNAQLFFASAATCPQGEPPQVEIELHAMEPKIDTSFTHEELTKGFISRVAWGPIAEGRGEIGGLAESALEWNYTRDFSWGRASPTAFCMSVPRITVDVVYNPLIYIASDVAGKQCQYDRTLAHEQRHVGTDLEIMNDLTADVKAALEEDVVAAIPREPLEGDAAAQEAMKDIDKHILAVMDKYYKKYASIRAERQSKFDTQENYDTEADLCTGRE